MVISYVKSSPSGRKVLFDVDGIQYWVELESFIKPLTGDEKRQFVELLLRLRLAGRTISAAELLSRQSLTIGAV